MEMELVSRWNWIENELAIQKDVQQGNVNYVTVLYTIGILFLAQINSIGSLDLMKFSQT